MFKELHVAEDVITVLSELPRYQRQRVALSAPELGEAVAARNPELVKQLDLPVVGTQARKPSLTSTLASFLKSEIDNGSLRGVVQYWYTKSHYMMFRLVD
jgi:hypothetical protein